MKVEYKSRNRRKTRKTPARHERFELFFLQLNSRSRIHSHTLKWLWPPKTNSRRDSSMNGIVMRPIESIINWSIKKCELVEWSKSKIDRLVMPYVFNSYSFSHCLTGELKNGKNLKSKLKLDCNGLRKFKNVTNSTKLILKFDESLHM